MIEGENPKYGYFSGLHGDELGIISSLEKAIAKYKSQIGSYVCIPECSPSAIRQKTRLNGEGVDLNRSFAKHPASKEAQAIVSVLAPYKFTLCVDFHEDVKLPGVYIYDSDNRENSLELSSFRKQVIPIAPLYTGVDDHTDTTLGRYVRSGYTVNIPPGKDEQGNYVYEGFLDYWALIEGKTDRWMTLEVPTSLAQHQKDVIVEIFFSSFILSPTTP